MRSSIASVSTLVASLRFIDQADDGRSYHQRGVVAERLPASSAAKDRLQTERQQQDKHTGLHTPLASLTYCVYHAPLTAPQSLSHGPSSTALCCEKCGACSRSPEGLRAALRPPTTSHCMRKEAVGGSPSRYLTSAPNTRRLGSLRRISSMRLEACVSAATDFTFK